MIISTDLATLNSMSSFVPKYQGLWEKNGYPSGKMGMAVSQVLASLEPCFYARSVIRIALKRLTEEISSSDKLNREIVMLILLQGRTS